MSTSIGHPFLVLAPIQSTSYPAKSSTTATASGVSTTVSPAQVDGPLKRASSVSSASSEELKGLRFLKLGPVYFGGEPGTSDYAD